MADVDQLLRGVFEVCEDTENIEPKLLRKRTPGGATVAYRPKQSKGVVSHGGAETGDNDA